MTFKIQINNPVENFYENPEFKKMFKPSIDNLIKYCDVKINSHVLISGGTGAGKSNAIMEFIRLSSKDKGTFKHIHIMHSIDEQLYTFLDKKTNKTIKFYKSLEDLPDVSAFEDQFEKKPEDREETLIIMDDFIHLINNKTFPKILKYGIMARKKGLTMLYLVQHFYALPPKMRNQMNYLVFLNIPNKRSLDLALSSYSIALNLSNVKQLLNFCTSKPLHFLKIALNSNVDLNKKFSCGWLDHFDISDMLKEQEEEEQDNKKKKLNKKSKNKNLDSDESDDDDYDARLIELLGRNWKN